MDGFVQDARYAFRILRKAPAFAAVIIITLGLAIGANTVLFSIISFSLIRPLPFPHPEQLVILYETRSNFRSSSVAWPNYVDWRMQVAPLFSELAAVRRDSFNLIGAGDPERVFGRMVTSELFPLAGVVPFLGRFFTAEEDKPGAPRTVVLSYGLWRRRFGGDRTVIGKSVLLSDDAYTVIGVLPKDFEFLSAADIYVPLGVFADRYQDRRMQPGILVFGRMRPSVTLAAVQNAMDEVSARLVELHPEMRGAGIRVALLQEEHVAGVRPALLILWASVGLVLVIALTNVANLLLARGTSRQAEIAVRMALGADRRRVVRQLLTEGILLASAGGVLALITAHVLLSAMSPLLRSLPRGGDVRIDMRVFLFTALASLLGGICFGLIPALRTSQVSFRALVNNASGSTHTHAGMRNALVIAEVAIAMMLLIGAGLLVQSFVRVAAVHPGFDPTNVLTAGIELPPSRYRDGVSIRKFTEEFCRRASALPGVTAVAVAQGMPLLGASDTSFMFEGKEPLDPSMEPKANMYGVTPGYFAVMRIPLVRGRIFEESDKDRNVIVIDERMARRYFANENPVGQRMAAAGPFPSFEIVGVVAHVENYDLEGKGPTDLAYYVPHGTLARVFSRIVSGGFLVLRSRAAPEQLVAPLRQLVQAIDPQQPIFLVRSMDDVISESLANRRLNVLLLTYFAALAVVLSIIGIYGVTSYLVEQRTREIGIRMALGAERSAVLRLIVGHGARLAAAGIGVGVAGALALSHMIAGLLYGVSAVDPATYAAGVAILAVATLAATAGPAARALRVDPIIALRAE